MNNGQYKRAPIQEAIIDLRLDTPCSYDAAAKAARKAKGEYFYSDPEGINEVTLDTLTGKHTSKQSQTGVKLSSLDRADVALFRINGFTSARLAPYFGWDNFCARTRRDWNIYKTALAHSKVVRIGVRYVNRIDIPTDPGALRNLENYLTVFPNLPPGQFAPMTAYNIQVVRPFLVDNCNIIINSGLIPSPLLNHMSLVLDIDVGCDSHIPIKDADMWELITRMRAHKNEIFEGCITDESRRIFDQ